MFSAAKRCAVLFYLFPCLANGVKFDEQVPVRTARPGERVEIACSHDDNSLLIMSWYEQRERSRALRLIGFGYSTGEPTYEDPFAARFQLRRESVQKGSLLIPNVTMADSAEYFCAASKGEATFGPGTKLTVLEPNIKITRPTVKVLPPSNLEDCKKKKKKLTLVCVATGFYPDHITVFWKLNGANLTSGVRTDDTALRNGSDGFYSITSRLRVPSKKWFDTRNSFTCLTSFYDGDSYLEDEDSIKGVNGGGMDREYFLKSGVTAKLSYSLFIAKSFLYGLFISAVVWKIRSSAAKHYE